MDDATGDGLRCLIVEDDADNARFIAEELQRLGYSTEICGDGKAALAATASSRWDIVILDRMLPGDVDGLAVLSQLRALGKKTPVLVLSALSAIDERVRGLKAGGDDYLGKPFALQELTARVEALVRRSELETKPSMLKIANLTLDLVARKVERAGQVINLQPREFKLLTFFMMNPDRVLTRTMLLEAVWDYRFDPRTNVIDVHVSRLRTKIEAADGPPLIYTERGIGYRMSANGPPERP